MKRARGEVMNPERIIRPASGLQASKWSSGTSSTGFANPCLKPETHEGRPSRERGARPRQ